MKIYIDGENFRKGMTRILLKEKVIKNSRDINAFPVRALLEDILESKDLEINYYASKIKLPQGYDPDEEVMLHVEKIKEFTRKWVPQLIKQNISYIKAGYLKVKSSKKCPNCGHKHDVLQEKGVDVRLAIDMIDEADSGNQKSLALMSSDTDLCPAIQKVKQRGVKVVYLCFANSPNRAVSAMANETVTISTAKLKKYTEAANG